MKIFWIIFLVWFIMWNIKNLVTFLNHLKINDAISKYHHEMIDERNYNYLVEYDDKQSYWKTFFKFWDWGYRNILSKDKFEIIKPYIKNK